MTPDTVSYCPACGHDYSGPIASAKFKDRPALEGADVTHDITSDGIVWCAVCEQGCGAKVVNGRIPHAD
ncbi:MAG: hypothetical protein KGI98_16975 [Euryarchaeota archaeon]|nr:hypothetical protein [Euryarchaeota archaeon]MDE1881836.1 hypothetical protein [Euryarchaeota archaeon]